jgi:hypothetical protein
LASPADRNRLSHVAAPGLGIPLLAVGLGRRNCARSIPW